MALTAWFFVPQSSDASYTAAVTPTASTSSAGAYSYATAVTGSTPWLWWRFGETTGNAADGSGNARVGTVNRSGVSRGVDGAILNDTSTGYHFDGQAGCVASSATLANPTTFTLELWFRSATTAGGPLISFGSSSTVPSGTTTNDRQLFLTPSGNVAFGINASSPVTFTSPGAYADGRWHLVDATQTAGSSKLYVDGVLVASGAANPANSTNAWKVGCGTINPSYAGAPTAGYLEADLDEVAVYTTALSPTTIANRMIAAPGRRPYVDTLRVSMPWAFWRLGEATSATMADSGTNGITGTTSASGLTGPIDGAIAGSAATTFDGAAGCMVSGSTQNNPTTFSLEAWFRTTSTSGGPIIGLMDNSTADLTGSTKRDRHIYLDGSGTVSFGVLASGTRQVISSGTSGFNDGAWHHVVATLGPGGQVLYLDGVAVAFGATTTAQNFTGYWHVGCQNVSTSWANYPNSFYFDGTIDEVAVYTTVLDAPTVQSHYRSGAAAPGYDSLVSAGAPWAWWRLADDTRHELTDSSGTNNRAWTSDVGLTRGVPGVQGPRTTMHFDGSAGCAVSVATQNNPTTLSLEIWLRTTTTAGGWIIGHSGISSPSNSGSSSHDRNLYMRNDGTLTFGTWTGSAATVTTTSAYNDGVWHHVVATFGAGGTKLFVDGALQASNATTTAQNANNYWHIGCGKIGGLWPGTPTSEYFAGDLDEAAIYTSELSATAVASHYRAGLGMLSMPGARSQSAPWTVWRLDETSGTTLADDTGNGRGATTTATGLTYARAGVLPDDGAIAFDGTNGCTVASTSQNDPELFSLEAWFTTTTTTGGSIVGFNPVNTTALPGSPYDRGVFMTDTGQVAFMVYPGSFSTVTSPAPYNDGAWHHAVATLGPNGQKLYLDGSLVASSATTTAYNYGGYWRIGCNNMSTWPGHPTSSYFDGTIDEVAIYTNELDPAAIAYRYALVVRPAEASADAYQTVTPTFYWPFDETSGNPTDASGNGRSGTASGSGITRSAAPAVGAGSAWTFNGSTGCTVTNSSFVNPTNYTESLWINTTTTTGGGLIGFTDSSTTTPGGSSADRMIYMTDAGTIDLGATASNVVTSPSTYNDGAWHHVVGSVGTRGMRLYVDGALVASSAYNTVVSYTGYWHVGCTRLSSWPSAPTSSYLSATIDEVAVYGVELSDAAVHAMYLAGTGTHRAVISGSSTITTVIGTGTASSTGDGGAATSATVNSPMTTEVDAAGSIYVADTNGCRVRKVTSNAVISTVMGTGSCTSTGDGGAATSATANLVSSVALAPDGGYYLSDNSGYRVRKVSAAGTITTYAGTGTAGTTGDGVAATSAQINSVRGLAVDQAGNLYIAQQTQCRIRKVTSSGVISTFAGTGTCGTSGDGGAATSATINTSVMLWVGPDSSVYLADWGACRVRQINSAGIISTVAGTGTCSSSGDGAAATSATLNHPSGIVGDGYGTLYVSEQSSNRVRKIDPAGIITTIVGTGTASSTGDGGAASSATVNGPYGLALDGAGRLLIAEAGGNRIRRVG